MGRRVGLAVLALFLAGLACRAVVLGREAREGDELIYRALVAQLEAGRGYTLRGHPYLGPGMLPPEQYGGALFFHPPGGIAALWGAHALLGERGLPLAQLLAYALFFFSQVALARRVLPAPSDLGTLLAAGLAALTPLMTHVASRLWIDAPLLAVATLSAALLLRSLEGGRNRDALAAGLVLGLASWIKVTALLILPGVALLALAIAPERRSARLLLWYAGAALLVQVPWELWQWAAVGSPFPGWAGRPAARLVSARPYVRYLTLGRSPWIYVWVLPIVLGSLAPALLLLAATSGDAAVRRRGLALVAWIAIVVGAHVVLGFLGFSKLLRYVVLVTPAHVALFALVVPAARDALRRGAFPGGRPLGLLLLGLAGVGLASEIWQGVYTPLVDREADLIRPWFLGVGPDAWP